MKIVVKNYFFLYLVAAVMVAVISCSPQKSTIKSGALSIEVNDQMQTLIMNNLASVPLIKGFQPSEFLVTDSNTVSNFKLETSKTDKISDFAGEGKSWEYTGKSDVSGEKITKLLTVKTYNDFPGWAFYKVQYVNSGVNDIVVKKWVNHSYSVESKKDTPDFWSFQASSSEKRESWILPVKPGFAQQNYLGMNDPDYGGGIPVLDIWRKDAGIAIGHTELKPKLVSLPVTMNTDSSNVKMLKLSERCRK